jgi:hypothetical protein
MPRSSSKLPQPSETRQRVGLTLGAMNCDPHSKLSVRLLTSVELSAGRTVEGLCSLEKVMKQLPNIANKDCVRVTTAAVV